MNILLKINYCILIIITIFSIVENFIYNEEEEFEDNKRKDIIILIAYIFYVFFNIAIIFSSTRLIFNPMAKHLILAQLYKI